MGFKLWTNKLVIFSYFSNGIFQEDDFGVFMGFKKIQKWWIVMKNSNEFMGIFGWNMEGTWDGVHISDKKHHGLHTVLSVLVKQASLTNSVRRIFIVKMRDIAIFECWLVCGWFFSIWLKRLDGECLIHSENSDFQKNILNTLW